MKGIEAELTWWTKRLQQGEVIHLIKPPTQFFDSLAFSDASSGMGIGIVIGDRWRAWRLHPNWQSMWGAQRDISWAEAIGFELLVRTLDLLPSAHNYFVIYGDNTSIVEGWWNGRHQNIETNQVFRWIHSFLLEADHVHEVRTKYVPSCSNPADRPSWGIYDHCSFLLPRVSIPSQLIPFITDVEDLPPSQTSHDDEPIIPTSVTRDVLL